jgi:hypothetical protein
VTLEVVSVTLEVVTLEVMISQGIHATTATQGVESHKGTA